MESEGMQYARSAEFEWLDRLEARIIEKFRGEGQLKLPDGPAASCAFGCVKLDDGRVVAECHLLSGAIRELIHRFDRSRGDGRLEGHTVEGSSILINEAALTHMKESCGEDDPGSVKMLLSCNDVNVSSAVAAQLTPARLTYGLTNLEFLGDERTHFGNGAWALDTFRFEVASTEIVVRQVEDYRQVAEEMKSTRTVAVTGEASVEVQGGVADLQRYDDMMNVVCTLFSLAKGKTVTWIYTKLWDQDGKLISWHMPWRPVSSWALGGALIGGNRATRLKEFVAHSYEPYLETRDRFNLPVAIGYYLASKSESELYAKFLLACTAMETLVSNFAEKHTQGDLRYVVPEKDFEDRETQLQDLLKEALREAFPGLSGNQVNDALVKVKELNRRSFRRVLKEMLRGLGVQYDKRADLQFIQLRHKVVHTGILGEHIQDWFRYYSALIELLDRIFLKILSYEGEYEKYSDQVRFIAR
jgi:YD repeat-containing protein